MYTLGINAAFHDSAACLVRDGRVTAAAEEERFTGIKHGKRPVPFSTYELPFHAIDYCLKESGITLRDVDHVAYSFDPALKLGAQYRSALVTLPMEPSLHRVQDGWESAWDPLFLSSIVNAPRQLASGAPHQLRARFRDVSHDGPFKWHFVSHHRAHAASAFFASPFDEAAVITLDGRGEKATTSYSQGKGMQLNDLGQVDMPHSLGLLYEKVTDYLGFLHSSDEYKVMALASYGKPAYYRQFRDMVTVGTDGQYAIAQSGLEEIFGPRRLKGGPVEQRHFDIAHSLQAVLEETALALVKWLHAKTGAENLCLAGGVGLNCVMNARLRDRGPFKKVWTQPAAGDAGTALGAALLVDARQRAARARGYRMDTAYLGPSFTDAEIEKFLAWSKQSYRKLNDVPRQVAEILLDDNVVGWFQGRMEFGPRALGARSILASPMHASMRDKLNEIKDREDFRPVAPVVLLEEAGKWFDRAQESPFMLFVNDVLPGKAPLIPAVTHIDGTARIQTIRREQNPLYYDLIKTFAGRTGVPVLVNTSLNIRGKPIVCTPRDAVECFWSSPLDAMVMGSFLLQKKG